MQTESSTHQNEKHPNAENMELPLPNSPIEMDTNMNGSDGKKKVGFKFYYIYCLNTFNSQIPCTPAIQRLHNTLRDFNIHSPTDAISSPISQKLADATRVRKGHQVH